MMMFTRTVSVGSLVIRVLAPGRVCGFKALSLSLYIIHMLASVMNSHVGNNKFTVSTIQKSSNRKVGT